MTLRAVVIGCGAIGSLYDENRPNAEREPFSHAGAYAADPDVELIGGVDPDADRRSRFTRRWGKPVWSSIEQMARTEVPEIWSLCTPPENRLSTAAAALRSKARGVLCEKPLAATLAEGVELNSLFERSAIPVVVNHSRRFDSFHQELGRRLRAGALGIVQRVVIHYVRGIANYGSHAFDLLRFLLADEIDWVASHGVVDETSRDPSLMVNGRMMRGAMFILLPLERAHYDVFEVDIWGTSGRCRVGHLGADVTWYGASPAAEWDDVILRPQPADFPPFMRGVMRSAVSELIAAINGAAVTSSLHDGLQALAAVTAARVSLRRGGQPVAVRDTFADQMLSSEERS